MLSSASVETEQLSLGELVKLREEIGTKKFAKLSESPSSLPVTKDLNSMKRAHKKRPREVTSKRRVSVLRNTPAAKSVSRDPRFDELSGSFSNEAFRNSYSFINDLRSGELDTLKADLKKCRDPVKKSELVAVINRLTNEQRSRQTVLTRQNLKSENRKQAMRNIKDGKNPYFAKKSDLRRVELSQKFEKLKGEGKLDTYVAKRRKKNLQKDKKTL